MEKHKRRESEGAGGGTPMERVRRKGPPNQAGGLAWRGWRRRRRGGGVRRGAARSPVKTPFIFNNLPLIAAPVAP